MPGHRAASGLVPDQDQERRLTRFRAVHPEIVILLLGAWPRAWVDGRKIEHRTLRGLLDELEEIYLPGAQAHPAGGPQWSPRAGTASSAGSAVRRTRRQTAHVSRDTITMSAHRPGARAAGG